MLAVAFGEPLQWLVDGRLRYARKETLLACSDFAIFAFDGLHVAAGGYVLEVGVFEEGGVFEPVA